MSKMRRYGDEKMRRFFYLLIFSSSHLLIPKIIP